MNERRRRLWSASPARRGAGIANCAIIALRIADERPAPHKVPTCDRKSHLGPTWRCNDHVEAAAPPHIVRLAEMGTTQMISPMGGPRAAMRLAGAVAVAAALSSGAACAKSAGSCKQEYAAKRNAGET